ncbi:Alpha/Beta hydrolase protein [Lasiosphaeria hispida]|uniref:Alpha/Beta hydrolase protein n=1 Tax=Lasiosphaeria hispida TaxID=260671 RepID=A0AAJ0HPW8_9PEZI|nr:Alpha/Beta hydrolase protein [Lasiosphaeria hispida]
MTQRQPFLSRIFRSRKQSGNIDRQDTSDEIASSYENPQPAFPDGIKVLHDCADATVDICFVHGLTGDRDNTWTAEGQFWPKTLLPLKLPGARILSYGYDAYIAKATSTASANRLIDHATNLLTDLTNDRALDNAPDRPLIFIAHSLGGLVCKEAILMSRNNPERHLRGIFGSVRGIIFMGTPHKGSWMADWAKMPASALGLIKSTNKSLLQLLETDNQLLESIQVRFWSMIRELREDGRRLEVTCFFEELPLPVIGTVVSKESATLEGYSAFSIHANHGDMVRFRSVEDNGFKRLLGELVRWKSQLGGASAAASRPASTPMLLTSGSSYYNHFGSGSQFNATGGTQNNNTGSGVQFLGSISGPVHIG